MNLKQTKNWAGFAVIVLLLGSFLLGGCANITSTDQPPFTISPGQTSGTQDVKVTYNYNDADKVQLSANNIVLKVGQKLILSAAPGFSGNTRFTSSGEYFFGDIMKQEDSQQTGKVVFTAQKPGKGKLQIIPNTNDLDRAVDLWVTVQQ